MRAVLEELKTAGPATVPQIARSLWLPRQAVQRVVDAAVELEYVGLQPNPHHRTSRLVAVTRSGIEAFQAVHDTELALLRQLAVELDPADVAASARVIAELTRHAREQAQTVEQTHDPTTRTRNFPTEKGSPNEHPNT